MTPSTCSPPCSPAHMRRASSAERGKSGVRLTFWPYRAGRSVKSASSSSVRSATGAVGAIAELLSPISMAPSSTVMRIQAPGMPPVDRSSALFWASRRYVRSPYAPSMVGSNCTAREAVAVVMATSATIARRSSTGPARRRISLDVSIAARRAAPACTASSAVTTWGATSMKGARSMRPSCGANTAGSSTSVASARAGRASAARSSTTSVTICTASTDSPTTGSRLATLQSGPWLASTAAPVWAWRSASVASTAASSPAITCVRNWSTEAAATVRCSWARRASSARTAPETTSTSTSPPTATSTQRATWRPDRELPDRNERRDGAGGSDWRVRADPETSSGSFAVAMAPW